jgi:hypothetical protein
MGHIRFKIAMLAILMLSNGFTGGCTTNSIDSKDESIMLAEIAKLLDVEFPVGARIVFSEKNDRAGEAAYFFVIYTPKPVKFNMSPSFKKSAEDTFESLRRVVKNKKFGKLKDKWAYCYEGKMQNGSWKIYQTNFETGSYLDIQQFLF